MASQTGCVSSLLFLLLLRCTSSTLLSSPPPPNTHAHPAPSSNCTPPPPPPPPDSACSPTDLQALRSIADALRPFGVMDSWQRQQATSINSCCGSWQYLTINCSSVYSHANISSPTSAACHMATDNRLPTTSNARRVIALEIVYRSPYIEYSLLQIDARKIGVNFPVAVCDLSALTSLRLMALPLSGHIPDCIATKLTSLAELDLSFNALTGSIPPSLFLAPHLQVLQLSSNNLRGSIPPFPPIFPITTLDLSYNLLTGSIPPFPPTSCITTFVLSYNGLTGSIPPLPSTSCITNLRLSGNALTGSIPFSLFLAHRLQYLHLHYNSLNGSIPSPLTLPNLTSLYLDFNDLSGPLPSFHAPKLSTLDLSYNHFSGSLQPLLHASNLSSLASLSLDGNLLDEVSPDAPSLRRLPNLRPLLLLGLGDNRFEKLTPAFLCGSTRVLDISGNKLSGGLSHLITLPDLQGCNLTWLQSVDLSFNQLTGDLLDWLGAFPNLKHLSLANNSLSSSIIGSSHWKNLTSLSYLDLSYCHLQGHLTGLFLNRLAPSLTFLSLAHNDFHGLISSQLGNMSNLEDLDLSYCNLQGQLTGLRLGPSFSSLSLAHNHLHGLIPSELANMSNLYYLDMSNNHFSGLPPLTLGGGFTQLEYLDLSYNNLAGELSTWLALLAPNASFCGRSLSHLNLSYNNISGIIPPLLFQCVLSNTSTVQLMLDHNLLNGSLPAIGPHIPPPIKVFTAANNLLTGHIPPSWMDPLYLELLDLRYNKLQGNLHQFFSTAASRQHYVHLRVLLLGDNLFTGHIPTTLGDITPALQIIDLSNNHLTGSIPVHTLSSVPALRSMYHLQPTATSNLDLQPAIEIVYRGNIQITVKRQTQIYTYIQAGFTLVDLSNNNMIGSIPTGLGKLLGLQHLNLAHNNLSGPIPSDLGNLRQLESLDLSFNNLEGSIPSTFAHLTSLEVFNVSYNPELSGLVITSNPQMEMNESYIGDHKLCGPFLANACTPPPTQGQPDPTPDQTTFNNRVARFVDEWVSIPGMCLGIVGGVLGCIWLLSACGWYQ